MFFHSNTGVLQVVIGEPPSNAPYVQGYSFINLERMYVIPWDPAAPMPSDTVYEGGLARTSKGALYIVEGTPSAAEKSMGVPARTLKGVAFVTTGAVGQGSTFTAPWGMVSSLGQIHIDASFGLGFADLGAGVVSTVAGISGATPTFTRATAASTVLSNGLIGTVASGSPRSHYDPTSLTYLGYLAEGARTNLVVQSEDLATTWTTVNATIGTNATASPSGAVNADKIQEDTNNGHLVTQTTGALANATVYVASAFLKAAERGFAFLTLSGTAFAAANHAISINLSTGAVASANGAPSGITTQTFPNGWFRVSFNATTAAADTGTINIYTSIDGVYANRNFAGTLNSGIYAWGAQLEAASFASSYIATVAGTVTKNIDVDAYPTTAGPLAAASSILITWTPLHGVSGTIFLWGTYVDANNYTAILHDGTNLIMRKRIGGANNDATIALTFVNGTTYKVGGSWGAGGVKVFLSGVKGTDSANTTNAQIAATMQFGTDGNGANAPFAVLRRGAIFPSQLPDAQMQAATS